MGTHIWEALVVLLVVLVLFGAGKIPRLAEDLGKGINAFKKGLKDGDTPAVEEKKADAKEETADKEAG